jgi:DNA-binding transcriptional LysR family regulator
MPSQNAKMQGASWDDLRFALAVLRHHSFAAAAKALSVDQTTVSRRITRLEERLGSILFERHPGTLSATRAGLDLQEHAEAIESAFHAACASTSGADMSVAGQVLVTAVPWLTNQILVPELPAFLASHPQLNLDLLAEASDLSLLRREADIALRLARPRQEGRAIARKIARVEYGVYAAREKAGHDLPWVIYVNAMDSLPQTRWVADQTGSGETSTSNVRINDAETLLSALRAGLGRSFLPCVLGDRDPSLERLDPGADDYSRKLWMLVHPDHRDLARIRATGDWLASTLQHLLQRA